MATRLGCRSYRCQRPNPATTAHRKKHNVNTNYNPDTIPPKSGVKPKAIGKRAALAALLGAAALYAAPMALTTPLANATDVGTNCKGTYAASVRSDGSSIESCTTTDKNGVKTQCSYIDGKKQGCIPVPLVKPQGTGPQPGRANDRLNLLGPVTDVQLQSPGSETQPGAGAAG